MRIEYNDKFVKNGNAIAVWVIPTKGPAAVIVGRLGLDGEIVDWASHDAPEPTAGGSRSHTKDLGDSIVFARACAGDYEHRVKNFAEALIGLPQSSYFYKTEE